ncbi:DUF4242 domain-containing protein [Desulfobacterota bacterium AH_259_B03_O07]|nr:DUF4242 domain-containing protein [Desulfobacterota bacterium AH_259_B03_O07]
MAKLLRCKDLCALDREYEAPSTEAIYEHAKRLQLPVDVISPISDEFDPSMFK